MLSWPIRPETIDQSKSVMLRSPSIVASWLDPTSKDRAKSTSLPKDEDVGVVVLRLLVEWHLFTPKGRIDETPLAKAANWIRLERPKSLDQSVGIERAIHNNTEAKREKCR